MIRCLGLIVALVVGLAPESASASEPSFTLSGHAAIGAGSLVGDRAELGGGGFAEVLFGGGPLMLGLGLGTWFVDDADGGRLATPIALSTAIRLEPDPVGATFRARAGFGAGAIGGGFHAHAFLSMGVYLDFRLDEVISLGVGSDVSFLVGKTGYTDFMPGVLLTFTPRSRS